MREYTLQDRTYPAQIFNRVIHRNHNSHRTTTGRYIIQTMYANGTRPNSYAGRANILHLNGNDYHGNNAVGTEVISHRDGAVALRIYVDGMGVYRPWLFYNLSRPMVREIDEMIREAFDIIRTENEDDYSINLTHHLKRKPICEEFREEYINADDFGTFLETKYNIQRGEHARENV